MDLDTERGTLVTPLIKESLAPHSMPTKLSSHGEVRVRKTASIWGYFCLIVFQVGLGI